MARIPPKARLHSIVFMLSRCNKSSNIVLMPIRTRSRVTVLEDKVTEELSVHSSSTRPRLPHVGSLTREIKHLKELPEVRMEAKMAKLQLNNRDEKDDLALQTIKHGFTRFKNENFLKNPKVYNALAKSQHPKFMVFACSDSRVSPSHILDFQPGEAFMYRNIAGFVPPYDKTRYTDIGAAIEYALEHLHVENILVMTHSKCGGVERLMSDEPKSSYFIDHWMNIAQPAKDKVKKKAGNLTFEKQCKLCEKEVMNLSLTNLLSYPFVKDKVVKKALTLKGGHYDFTKGTFSFGGLKL